MGAVEPHELGRPDEHADERDDTDDEIVPSRRIDEFRRGSLAGAVLNGIALGLREVLDPVKREEAPIVQDLSGDPPRPKHVDAQLDPDDPTASTVVVRPWLAEDEDRHTGT